VSALRSARKSGEFGKAQEEEEKEVDASYAYDANAGLIRTR
jgi:hypothetical protein